MSGGFTPGLIRKDVTVDGRAHWLASEHVMAKRGGITMDADRVAPDDKGNKVVKGGTLVVKRTSTGKYEPWGAGASEVQTVTLAGASGTFTLTAGGDATAPISATASAATVQSALEALDAFQPGDLDVTKSGTVYTIRYSGSADEPPLTASTPTGGGTATVATTTAGGGAQSGVEADTAGYLVEGINLRDGDVICGQYLHCSVLAARVTPAVDSAIRTAVAGRITFQ